MTISKKITDVKQNLEEMSAAGAGAIAFSPKVEGEERLREVIRKSIKIYSKKKNKLSQEQIKEQKLRNVIRNLITEAKQSSFPRPTSTMEGILSKFFNSSGIYESVRDQFYELQTDREEKVGFIKTFLERSSEVMMSPDGGDNKEAEELQEVGEEATDEAEPVSREKNILDKWGAFVPSDIEKDLKINVKPKKDKSQDPKTKKDSPEEEQIESFEKRGADSAIEIFEQRIKNELRKIMLKLLGDEKEGARVLVLQNFAAWFDMWTEDSDEMDKFLIQCLRDNNVPIPEQFKVPEDMPEEPVDSDLADLTTDDSGGIDTDLPAEEETNLEEDLFSLLEQDLE
jgi:hypothetical protein